MKVHGFSFALSVLMMVLFLVEIVEIMETRSAELSPPVSMIHGWIWMDEALLEFSWLRFCN